MTLEKTPRRPRAPRLKPEEAQEVLRSLVAYYETVAQAEALVAISFGRFPPLREEADTYRQRAEGARHRAVRCREALERHAEASKNRKGS